MPAHESIDGEQTFCSFDWVLGDQVGDGRYGPIFSALRTDTAKLITAEKLVFGESRPSSALAARVLSHLPSKPIFSNQPNVVSYLGHRLKDGHIFMLKENLTGGTLRDFIQQNGKRNGSIPQTLARMILRQIVLGLEQLQTQGFSVVFLDSNNVLVDNKCGVKIDAPLLDITLTGHSLPPTVVSLPELILGEQNMRKVDIWLLGIIAAQLLTGDCNIVDAGSASTVAAQIKQAQGSAWEPPVLRDMASKLQEEALDFLRQCLTFDTNQRASISDLQEHPFLSLDQ